MTYPEPLTFKVPNLFNNQEVTINLYSGLTTFVGLNASGKTQTLKTLRNELRRKYTTNSVRYLSSNRIGTMENYRSKVNQGTYSVDNYSIGDQNTKNSRKEIETATGDFFAMDDRKDIYIKVTERLSKLFSKKIYIQWISGNLKVFIEDENSNAEYPIVYEASGLINIISILAALYDEDIKYLLIDEPEVSLHPQLQSYLLREIKKAAKEYNKSIIISTHSADMIELNTINDLPNFIFFKPNSIPKQLSPESPELNNKQIKDFILRMGLIYKEGFFAKKIMLMEGISDYLICRYLCTKFDINLDAAGTHIIPIDGKGHFPIITKLFNLIGKDVIVLTDLDGFTDNNDIINIFSNLDEAKQLADELVAPNLQTLVRTIKNSINEQIEIDKNNLESIYSQHLYYNQQSNDDTTAVKRSIIAQLFLTNDEELANWPNKCQWQSLKTKLTKLLETFEKLGCFILRKGSIENYYLNSTDINRNAKVSDAACELSILEETPIEIIAEKYDDIIRALKFAAIDKTIDESSTIKKELLSELAPILDSLNDMSNEKEILSIIRQIKNNTISIFDYKLIENNGKKGITVYLKSKIINVTGFPLTAYPGDNVNDIVKNNIIAN